MATNCPFCGKLIELPGMREIRQLPVAGDPKDVSTGSSRNETVSWLFSGGLLVGVVAGLCGWALMAYADSLVTESILENQIEFGRSQLDLLPAGHLWDAWDSMTVIGLPDWEETTQVRYNKQAGHLRNIAFGLYGLSVIGGLSLIVSFFISRK